MSSAPPRSWRRLLIGTLILATLGAGTLRLLAWIRPPDPVYLDRDQAISRVLEPGVCGSTVRVSFQVSALTRQHGRALASDGELLYPPTGNWPATLFLPSEYWVAELRASGPGVERDCRLVLDAQSGAILRELGNPLPGDSGLGGG